MAVNLRDKQKQITGRLKPARTGADVNREAPVSLLGIDLMFFINRRNLKAVHLPSLVLCAALLGGCEEDLRQSYTEPVLTVDRVATITGGHGYYVTEIDGDRVDSGNVTWGLFGGNTAKLAAGTHRLRFFLQDPNGGNNNRTWYVEYDFEAGHTYHFGCYSLVDLSLTIVDDKTKVQKTFDPQDDLSPKDM
jgi:hypothetical protein